MNRKQAEKMLKRLADTAEILSVAQASLSETNAVLVDLLAAAMTEPTSDNTPQTMQ